MTEDSTASSAASGTSSEASANSAPGAPSPVAAGSAAPALPDTGAPALPDTGKSPAQDTSAGDELVAAVASLSSEAQSHIDTTLAQLTSATDLFDVPAFDLDT